jgi:hemerythrin-like domain-containing protein
MIRINQAPDASFDEPLEMLHACHERIRRHCQLIERLAAHVAAHGVDQEARVAARNICRFFEEAGANHHIDEELDVFPAMVHYAAGDSPLISAIDGLRNEHHLLEELWYEMRDCLQLDSEQPKVPDAITAARFTNDYERHIAFEESQIFPHAKVLIPADTLKTIGERMAKRRQTERPAPVNGGGH